MKKYFAILFLLSGCMKFFDENIMKVKNDKCSDIYKVKIFQVLDNGSALAMECKKEFGYESCSGKTIALMPQRNVQFYDEMMLEPEAEKCFIQNGVYRYEAKNGMNKTVPVMTFDYKYAPNTKEEFLNRIPEFIKDFKFLCEQDLKYNKNKKDNKKCDCFANNFEQALVKLTENKDTLKEDVFKKDFLKSIESTEVKCGKIDF